MAPGLQVQSLLQIDAELRSLASIKRLAPHFRARSGASRGPPSRFSANETVGSEFYYTRRIAGFA